MSESPALPIERTLVLVKPDAFSRGLTGEIIARFERAGLALIGLKLTRPTIDFARKHYRSDGQQLSQMGNKSLDTYKDLGIDPIEKLGTNDPEKIGAFIHEWNAEFLSSGPVVAMVFCGVHAVQKARKITGKTIPLYADPGTIRGDYASTSPAIANAESASVFNMIHASDDEEDPTEPAKEIAYWFEESELHPTVPIQWQAMFKSYAK